MREVLLTAAALWLAAGEAGAAGQKKTPSTAPPLKNKVFPDETGSIGLAPGWILDGAYRGSCGCNGPEGQKILMGFPWNILRPNHPLLDNPVAEQAWKDQPKARDGDLEGALRQVIESKKEARLLSLRSRPAPPGLDGVPAKYFLYQMLSKGKKTTALGYFTGIVTDDNTLPSWSLYSSAVLAPSERFMKDLPAMMAMWNSWRPNGKKPKAGSESAMIDANIASVTKFRQDNLKAQQEAFERMLNQFKKVM